jgi:hypothetical protein
VGKHAELLERKGLYARLYAVNYGLSRDGHTPSGDSGENGGPAAARASESRQGSQESLRAR